MEKGLVRVEGDSAVTFIEPGWRNGDDLEQGLKRRLVGEHLGERLFRCSSAGEEIDGEVAVGGDQSKEVHDDD